MLIRNIIITVFGVVVLFAVRYSSRVWSRKSSWGAWENTQLARIADEDGNYLPGAKLLFYTWIPYAIVAMWAELPGFASFVVLAVLFTAFNVYSVLHSPARK